MRIKKLPTDINQSLTAVEPFTHNQRYDTLQPDDEELDYFKVDFID